MISRDPAPDHTANLLGALALALHDDLDDALAGLLDRSETAAAALVAIGTWPGRSLAQLSRILDRDHSTAVRLVDRLEDDGLVRRTTDPADARRVTLGLTDSGRERVRTLLDARRQVLTDWLEPLDVGERRQLHRLLDRLLSAGRREPDEGRAVCRLCEHTVCRGSQCPVGRSCGADGLG